MKKTMATTMPKTKLNDDKGYAKLNGNTLSICIHSNEAKRKHKPQAANGQLVSRLPKKDHVQANGFILTIASFRNTCPPASMALCMMAIGNIL